MERYRSFESFRSVIIKQANGRKEYVAEKNLSWSSLYGHDMQEETVYKATWD